MLNMEQYIGEWDNFQQYWLENTEEDQHREEVETKHRHFVLKISMDENGGLLINLYEGRNGKNHVDKFTISPSDMTSLEFNLKDHTLFVSGRAPFDTPQPYRFLKSRRFSGWIEYPISIEPEEMYHQGNLEVSDQGGLAELDLKGINYTIELTQLLFQKKLSIMKLAVYDLPLEEVEINSRAISYTWVNPDAKRIGINLRKILSGWTMIEPGFVNQNTWRNDDT
ncbi:MAG: hypothetical protein AAFU57_07060 [Bacteroidota bacterium]